MPRYLKLAALCVVGLFLAGCADIATPVAVIPPKPEHDGEEPDMFGVACAYKILWVFSFGDTHIAEAKKKGGVVDIATVEVVKKTLLFDTFPLNVYQRQCTEVAGYS